MKTTNIKGYECYYLVNTKGEIFRINEKRRFVDGNIEFIPIYKKMSPISHPDGYLRLNLCVNSIQIHKMIHRVVAEAFIPNPNNYAQVNHIDGDKTNNKVENLEWCNNSMNQLHNVHILKNHNVKDKFGGKAPKAIKINQIDKETGEIVKTWDCIKDAIDAGAASSMVCRALKNSSMTCKGYRWQKQLG